jgi:hypothetical protein
MRAKSAIYCVTGAAIASLVFVSVAQEDATARARQEFSAHSPVVLQMVDQASLIAHVVVTNLAFGRYRSVTGDLDYTAACAVKEVLKGPTNQTSVVLKTRLIKRESQRVMEGSNYIVFVTALTGQRAMLYPGDYLTDHWLGLQPCDPELLAELRALLGKPQAAPRPQSKQESQKESTEDVRIKIE